MDGKNNGSFWPSYVDVMTTLFAITLVLFVVSFARFKIKETELKESNEILQTLVDEYENIITVYSTVSKIDSTEYFGYNEQYLKHLFTVDVEYQTKEFHIDRLKLDKTDTAAANKVRRDILIAGNLVKSTIQSIEKSDSVDSNIKFLVVIEGQSSRIRFDEGPWMNNYTLSYLRAQYLNKFWKENGIDIDAIPRCELIISGSGEQGVPRNIPNESQLRNSFPNQADYQKAWNEIEMGNQRFLIHIVPVIGNIDVSKEKIDHLKGKKTVMEQQDLNAEYGRIFGVVHYPTLFDKDDSAYSELRKEIIDTPRLFTSTNKLPFESIYDFSIEQEIDCNRDYLEQKPGNTDLYDVIVGIRNHVTTIITGILSVLGGYKQATETSQFTNPAKNNHVFWITKAGRCRAYGYFDKETKNFYIGVGSLISIIDDSDYIASSSYRNRHRLIDKYGVNIGNYVKIKKDVKCRTAVAAARYTLGAMVNLDLWKDSQGKTLYEVYPDYFFR